MLKQKGWKIYYVPEVSILHYKGISHGLKKHSKEISTADASTRKKASEERFKAMKIFYKKHYDNKYPWSVTRLVYLGISLKQLIS
jgi:GT2 family glycosyltransferase